MLEQLATVEIEEMLTGTGYLTEDMLEALELSCE
jgi:hypothetical protein